MRVTKTQKDILSEMRDGAELRYDSDKDSTILIRPNGMTSKVTNIVSDKLFDMGLIERKWALLKSVYYRLSETGKTIDIS